jgi:hypothetical protein
MQFPSKIRLIIRVVCSKSDNEINCADCTQNAGVLQICITIEMISGFCSFVL